MSGKPQKQEQRIEAVASIGNSLMEILDDHPLINQAFLANPWFTPDFIRIAIRNLLPWFGKNTLAKFTAGYPAPAILPKKIGLIAAGNVPLVGMHDLLMILLSGNHAAVRLSSKDNVIFPALLKLMHRENNPLAESINLNGFHNDISYLLFTGSDNTARYIDFHFQQVRKVMRKSRFSIAFLENDETDTGLRGLAEDMLLFHGMGCRNVSNMIVPENWNHESLGSAIRNFPEEQLSREYTLRVKYLAATLQTTATKFFHCGNLLLLPSEQPGHSQPGIVNVVYGLKDQDGGISSIESLKNSIQCTVGRSGKVAFGETQKPAIDDFADGIDVMKILSE